MAQANTIEQQVMAYLVQCAIERRTTTYEEVAAHFDLPTTLPRLSQVMSPILYRIFDWCEKKRLPKLTVLVVRKSGADMMLPGKGFWTVSGLTHADRMARILLTEMWTTDVFEYFTVPLEGVPAITPGGLLTENEAYAACLKTWNNLGNNPTRATDEQLMHWFDNVAKAAYGSNLIRIRFYSPLEVTFEYNTGDEWVRLKLTDVAAVQEIMNGD